jgi:hypothetical protein
LPNSNLTDQHNTFNSLIFTLKTYGLTFFQFYKNQKLSLKTFEINNNYINDPIISMSESELWNKEDNTDNWILTAGKIENLRIASKKLNGLEVKANEVFSFWKHLGNPNFGKGYVVGREIKEGCIVPTIAGGLCQLSNALYDAALKVNFEIIERHKHTKVVKGSLAEKDRDATVKWNYIDLKFKSQYDFRIESELTSTHLIVKFKSNSISKENSIQTTNFKQFNFLNDCYSCGNDACSQHEDQSNKNQKREITTYILDEKWIEFDDYISSKIQPKDIFIVPIFKFPFVKTTRYNWKSFQTNKVKSVNYQGIKRALKLRFSKNKNPFELSLELDQNIAESIAKLIPIESTHLVISQNLLPYFMVFGSLGGRTFDILMTRMPIEKLQNKLDLAHFLYPNSKTLKDFRTKQSIKDSENKALQFANKIITPHTEIANLFPPKTEKLSWKGVEQISTKTNGTKILFPSATIGRKGAYEMRQIAKALNLDLVIFRKNHEAEDFWKDVNVEYFDGNYENIGLIIYPTHIENQPRHILKALQNGIPVITTSACGLQPNERIKIIDFSQFEIAKTEIMKSINELKL